MAPGILDFQRQELEFRTLCALTKNKQHQRINKGVVYSYPHRDHCYFVIYEPLGNSLKYCDSHVRSLSSSVC